MQRIKEVCRQYLDEEIDELEFMRRLVPAIGEAQLYVEVAQCLQDYLDGRP